MYEIEACISHNPPILGESFDVTFPTDVKKLRKELLEYGIDLYDNDSFVITFYEKIYNEIQDKDIEYINSITKEISKLDRKELKDFLDVMKREGCNEYIDEVLDNIEKKNYYIVDLEDEIDIRAKELYGRGVDDITDYEYDAIADEIEEDFDLLPSGRYIRLY